MENEIITDWLDKYGNSEIYKKVEDYIEKTNMEDEYIIINRTTFEKRIEELEGNYKNLDFAGKNTIGKMVEYEINLLKQILSQSTPLIPEIEKSYHVGRLYQGREGDTDIKTYISILKLNI